MNIPENLLLTPCSNCGEHMDGDGYTVVLHCPNADEAQVFWAEPDANPIECKPAESENARANPDRPV